MSEFVAIEIALRGASASLFILVAVQWLLHGKTLPARLGAAFSLAISGYVLVSSPATEVMLGPILLPAQLLAIFGAVFLWWFLLSLFDDGFRFKLWHWLPFALLTLTLPFRGLLGDGASAPWVNPVHQLNLFVLLGHAFYLALRDVSGDLVEPRRRFRVVFAILTALTGFVIGAVELLVPAEDVPNEILLLHAGTLLFLAAGFALWGLSPRAGLLPGPREKEAMLCPTTSQHDLAPEDRVEFDRLLELMNQGAWREEALTVGKLARKLGAPEHRLRRLINRGSGFRNFSAFLNAYRIEAAERELSDPAKARTQILQLALNLGYGSIGPFNRAFRQASGQTPTEFRRRALVNFEKE